MSFNHSCDLQIKPGNLAPTSHPKLLSLNTRSAFPKLDVISSTLTQQNINCFVAAETWFNDNHSNDITSIKNFICYRDDRKNRIAGGVAIYVSDFLRTERLLLEDKPCEIETV